MKLNTSTTLDLVGYGYQARFFLAVTNEKRAFSRKHGEGSSAKTLALLHKLDSCHVISRLALLHELDT